MGRRELNLPAETGTLLHRLTPRSEIEPLARAAGLRFEHGGLARRDSCLRLDPDCATLRGHIRVLWFTSRVLGSDDTP
jgi:hypothetical protein